MERYFRSSSRGASVLGALIIALMLGTGAVATYELVNPSLTAVPATSQLAATPGTAKTSTTKTPTPTKEEKAKELAEAQCKKMQADNKGKPVGFHAPNTPQTTELKEFTENKEKGLCVSILVESNPKSSANCAGNVCCYGLLSRIQLVPGAKSAGASFRVLSQHSKSVPKGTCQPQF